MQSVTPISPRSCIREEGCVSPEPVGLVGTRVFQLHRATSLMYPSAMWIEISWMLWGWLLEYTREMRSTVTRIRSLRLVSKVCSESRRCGCFGDILSRSHTSKYSSEVDCRREKCDGMSARCVPRVPREACSEDRCPWPAGID